MTETKTHTLALDQFDESGKALLTYAQQHPTTFGLSCLAITAGVVTIIVPLAIGFGAAGPVAGTMAAAWQASIGNVVAGSLFATLQSMTMSGVLVAMGGGLVAGGVAGLVGAVEWAKGVDWARSVDWTKGADWAQWAQAAGFAGGMVEQWARCVDLEEVVKGTVGGERRLEGNGVGGKRRLEENRGGGEEYRLGGDGEGNGVGSEGRLERNGVGGKEGWKRTEEGVKNIDWEGTAKGLQRAFTWW